MACSLLYFFVCTGYPYIHSDFRPPTITLLGLGGVNKVSTNRGDLKIKTNLPKFNSNKITSYPFLVDAAPPLRHGYRVRK